MSRIDRFRHLIGRLVPYPHTIVLAYHRIVDVENDPQLLCVSPKNFVDHLEILRCRFNVVTLSALRQRIPRNQTNRPTVVITFDDGYADNLHFAYPCLEAANLPATVFVTAGKVGSDQEFWWDELEALILKGTTLPDELSLLIDSWSFYWRFENRATSTPMNSDWNVLMDTNPDPSQELYLALARWIRDLPLLIREAAMKEIRTWVGVDDTGRPTHRAMSAAELCALTRSGLIEIGSHTVNHPVLSELPIEQQHAEITKSKRLLEEILGKTITSFSYPFGGKRDYTKATVKLVKAAGYTSACSNFEGHVTLLTDPYQTPRFLVRNWEVDEFSSQLEKWIDF